MKLIDVLSSRVEDVKKLVFQEDTTVHEVSYLRKGDGKDIVVIPTQTNCRMGCTFCHLTGNNRPTQNLSSDQMIALIKASIRYQLPANKTLLISFMGAGEPLLNVEQVIETAKCMGDTNAMGWYDNVRFALATIIPSRKCFEQFKQLVGLHGLPFKLHLSLHSLDAPARKSLMPSASPILDSWNMLKEYASDTGQPTEVHYTLIDGINDKEEDLARFEALSGRDVPIKLLRFAEKKQEPLMHGSSRTAQFTLGLEQLGYRVEVYSPPGRDIGSSCGQFIADQYVA